MLKNNKKTVLDEVVWGMVSIVCIVFGAFCMINKPEIGIFNGNVMQWLGGIVGTIGIVLIPIVIYNLMHNEK